MEKLEPKIDNSTTGYNLLKIIISLISLKHQDNNEEINTILIEKLAMVLNISTEELWTKYTNDLLNHVNNEPKSWTSVSDSACIFQTILTECGSCFGQNLPIIGDILTQSLDCDVDAELRLKLFCTLANCFENKSITFKGAEDLNDFFHKLIESINIAIKKLSFFYQRELFQVFLCLRWYGMQVAQLKQFVQWLQHVYVVPFYQPLTYFHVQTRCVHYSINCYRYCCL